MREISVSVFVNSTGSLGDLTTNIPILVSLAKRDQHAPLMDVTPGDSHRSPPPEITIKVRSRLWYDHQESSGCSRTSQVPYLFPRGSLDATVRRAYLVTFLYRLVFHQAAVFRTIHVKHTSTDQT
jgi:hypothetical protein